MENIYITAYPYAVTQGMLKVPKDVKAAGYEAVREYIFDNFDSISFGSPELDYCGTEMEFYTEEGEEI